MSNYAIHSEARAGHWVAWVISNEEPKPIGSVILPGQTQEEAESNAKIWLERLSKDSSLLRK